MCSAGKISVFFKNVKSLNMDVVRNIQKAVEVDEEQNDKVKHRTIIVSSVEPTVQARKVSNLELLRFLK